ncbi:MAG: phage tail tape measure protein, partial [Oscillospiraceae bacterium]|nr:phage tail tape measure protein [Oscillospiraceae bacterium]
SMSGEIDKEDKKIQSAEKAVDKFDKTLVDTSSDSNKTAKNVEKLSDSAKNAESGFNAAAVAVGTFMGNLALNVLNDAANLMKQITEGALDTGSSFEAAMSQVAATQGFSISDIQNNTEGAAYTMDLLTEKAREMGSATSFSASEAADGLNTLLMSGYDATESIEMVENVLHGAEAGEISIAESAKYIAGSMKGFEKQSASFADNAEASAYYADLMAKGATLAATNVANLGQGLSGVAATANTYNQQADSVTVSLLRLAEQGELGSAAATSLTAAMKNIYAPTDTAKAALESLGISAYDAEGNTRDFNTVVDELNNALNGLGDDQKKNDLINTIFGIQGAEAFNKMVVTSGDKLQKFYDGIAEASGSAALQSETMLDNLKGDITKLQSAYSDLEITIYNGANEPLRHVVQTITDDMLPAINHLVSGVDGADKEIGSAVGNLVSTILTETKDLLPTFTGVANNIVLALVENLPQMASGFGEMAMTLLNGLTDILPKMLPAMS